MGNCPQPQTAQREDEIRTRNIETQLARDRQKSKQEIKLLLLGAGESGKTTILRQMRLIHHNGYTADDRIASKHFVYRNIIDSIKTLEAALEKYHLKLLPENEEHAMMIRELRGLGEWIIFTQQLAISIKALWNDPAIKEAASHYAELQLNDATPYFLDEVERIGNVDYVPTDDDMLRVRIKTTGITELQFEISNRTFRLVDVGGQRSERRKWVHCFQDVNAVIFCVALSEFDLVLSEDRNVNRMQESLSLFQEVLEQEWFYRSAVILFLNKTDLFAEKIRRGVDLRVCFPNYDGGADIAKATDYVKEKFASKGGAERNLYTHLTCATNTDNIRFVFAAVKDMLLSENLQRAGFPL